MMGGRRKRVLDEHARVKHAPQRAKPHHNAKQSPQHHGVLHRGLTRIAYRLLMPLAIASHSSWSLGRNSVMATMAITTKTPTKMAYSVVP